MTNLEYKIEQEFLALGTTFVMNWMGSGIIMEGCVIDRFTQSYHKNDIPVQYIGNRETVDFVKGMPTINFEFKGMANKLTTQNKPINFKEFISKKLTIEDLFKLINKKIKK